VRFVTAAGWQAARDAGIRVVIDLRNPDEATATARPADVQTMLIPLDDIEDLDLWRRLNSEGLNGTLLSLAGVTPEAIAADYELTFGQLAPVYAALGLEQDEPDVREYLKSQGTTVSETIATLIRGLDVAGYLAAAGVSGANIDALRRRLL